MRTIVHFSQKLFSAFNRFQRKVFVRVWVTYLVFLLAVSVLLMCPFVWENSTAHAWKPLDSFYLVTSAFSNTGLKVRSIGMDMTFAGQFIIFLLMIGGGIGLLFFKIMFFQMLRWLFNNKSIRFVLQEQNFERGHVQIRETRRMLRVSFVFLLLIELIGFIFLFFVLFFSPPPELESFFFKRFAPSFWNALFHSISATNNSGFDVFPAGHSLSAFESSGTVQTIFIIQFVLGGIGFVVFLDLWDWFKAKVAGQSHRFSFFTKFSLYIYVAVAIGGLSLIFLVEGIHRGLESDESSGAFISRVVFNTLSCRSAGYSTVDIGTQFTSASKLVMILLMWIGTSPLSTGGGIKTTIFAIMLLSLFAVRDRNNKIIIKGRSIQKRALGISVSTVFLSLTLIFIGVFLSLWIGEFTVTDAGETASPRLNFIDNLFYFTSAIGNVGLNTIPLYDQPNWITFKIYSIFLMIIGQIGLSAAFAYKHRDNQRNFASISIELPL